MSNPEAEAHRYQTQQLIYHGRAMARAIEWAYQNGSDINDRPLYTIKEEQMSFLNYLDRCGIKTGGVT